MRRLHKDTRGEAVLLALLFLMWVAFLFLAATSQISTGVAARSQLTRLCDEIAVNVSMVGLDRDALAMGVHILDEQAAHAIAVSTFTRAKIPQASFTIEILNGEVFVRATLGGVSSSSVATPRKVRN